MGYYLDQRAEIKAQLEAVSGIGRVYSTRKNPRDIDSFKQTFAKDGVINSCQISRGQGNDLETGVGSGDEAMFPNWTDKNDTWEITLLYGYADNDTESLASETIFNNLVDAIEEQFRFLDDLNGVSFQSYALQRIQCGIFEFLGGLVFCHKAVWTFRVQERVENPNPEE